MGNWVGKDKGVVHPIDDNQGEDRTLSPNRLIRVKVRMTKRQLKEIMAQVDKTRKSKLGHRNLEELGCVILQECLQGRLSARVVAESDHEVSKYERSWMLSNISEEDEHEHEHEHHHLL